MALNILLDPTFNIGYLFTFRFVLEIYVYILLECYRSTTETEHLKSYSIWQCALTIIILNC